MRRNTAALWLAAAAVLPMSLLLAPGAAANPVIVPGEANVTVSAEQIGTHEFDLGSRALKCSVAKASGSLADVSETLTLAPEYKECSTTPVLGISFPGTVNMNGCEYLLHAETPGGEAEGTSSLGLDLVCPEGKAVVISIYKSGAHTETWCTVTISPQSGLQAITATNTSHEGKANDVKLEHSVSIQVHNTGGLCGETEQTAKYTGTTTLKATNGESEEAGLAILKTPKVVLCKANEVPCQKTNILEGGIGIEAKAQNPQFLVTQSVIDWSIVCESSEWESSTSEKEGDPRLKGSIPALGLNFIKCEDVEEKKSCTVSVKELSWKLLIAHEVGQYGRMAVTENSKGAVPGLEVICGSGFNCLFKAGEEDEGLPAVHFEIWGDNSSPQIRAPGVVFKRSSCMNTAILPSQITLSAVYSVSKPTPLWVSYVQ